jgi:hypothetical protein
MGRRQCSAGLRKLEQSTKGNGAKAVVESPGDMQLSGVTTIASNAQSCSCLLSTAGGHDVRNWRRGGVEGKQNSENERDWQHCHQKVKALYATLGCCDLDQASLWQQCQPENHICVKFLKKKRQMATTKLETTADLLFRT